MTYYLIVGNARKGATINISTLPGFEDLNPHRLEDIVKFTNSFKDEVELTTFLKYFGALERNNDNLTYGIYRKKPKEDKMTKLQLGISFADDAKYFEVDTLVRYISTNIGYPSFFKDFVNRYYSIYKAKKDELPKIHPLHYLPGIYSAYRHYIEQGYFYNDTRELVSDFVRKYSRDFTGLRDLAMFAINDNRKKNGYETNLDTIARIREELEYYKGLLSDGDVTMEQQEAYESHVERLENEIETRCGR